jgi:hypothetical protein
VKIRGAWVDAMPALRPATAVRLLILATLGFSLLAMPVAAQESVNTRFEHLVRSPMVHCAFYREYDIDPQTGNRLLVEGRSNSLTHYQRQRGERVRSIDTRRAGAVDVQVVQGRYLHYIERNAGMYVVTTVYACLERDPQSNVCINYGAVNARHFDARVLREPDRVYEELQSLAEPGFCDHSFIHLQEAANAPQRR